MMKYIYLMILVQLWMENFCEISFLFDIIWDITYACRSFCMLRKVELRLYFGGQADSYN